jgi:hypothetical protein
MPVRKISAPTVKRGGKIIPTPILALPTLFGYGVAKKAGEAAGLPSAGSVSAAIRDNVDYAVQSYIIPFIIPVVGVVLGVALISVGVSGVVRG